MHPYDDDDDDNGDDDDSSKTLASLSIILTVGFDCTRDGDDDFFLKLLDNSSICFLVFGRFWLFLAVFSTQDLKHRPPDICFHLVGPIFIEIRWL